MNTEQIFIEIFEELPLSRGLPSHFQQLGTRHPEIGQREQRCQLCGVFLQTTVAHLHEAKDHDVYNSALAAGYEAPDHVFRGFSDPNVLSAQGMTAYLVEETGLSVVTSYGILVNDHVGPAYSNVATRPEYRRRGHARAATAAVLRDACTQGTHAAFLHCTPAGRAALRGLTAIDIFNRAKIITCSASTISNSKETHRYTQE
jgi:hypothetical protein